MKGPQRQPQSPDVEESPSALASQPPCPISSKPAPIPSRFPAKIPGPVANLWKGCIFLATLSGHIRAKAEPEATAGHGSVRAARAPANRFVRNFNGADRNAENGFRFLRRLEPGHKEGASREPFVTNRAPARAGRNSGTSAGQDPRTSGYRSAIGVNITEKSCPAGCPRDSQA